MAAAGSKSVRSVGRTNDCYPSFRRLDGATLCRRHIGDGARYRQLRLWVMCFERCSRLEFVSNEKP